MLSIVVVVSAAVLLVVIGLIYVLYLPETNSNSDTNELDRFQIFHLL